MPHRKRCDIPGSALLHDTRRCCSSWPSGFFQNAQHLTHTEPERKPKGRVLYWMYKPRAGTANKPQHRLRIRPPLVLTHPEMLASLIVSVFIETSALFVSPMPTAAFAFLWRSVSSPVLWAEKIRHSIHHSRAR